MEKMTVKAIVRENKKNAETFGVFMTERIIEGRRPGSSLRQFLADELQKGRAPIRGEKGNYDPIKERVIITAPRSWGADAPDELVGASVRVDLIGTIPVSDDPDDGIIEVIRLDEPTPGFKPDIILDGTKVVENVLMLQLGRNVQVQLVPPPMNLGDDPEPDDPDESDPDDDDPDDDDEGYW